MLHCLTQTLAARKDLRTVTRKLEEQGLREHRLKESAEVLYYYTTRIICISLCVAQSIDYLFTMWYHDSCH
jgi:hypothetical protein